MLCHNANEGGITMTRWGDVPILTQYEKHDWLLNNFFIAKNACFTYLINYLSDERLFELLLELT